MRNIVSSSLVPSVAGSCLPDAIPPENRKNLVNPNGETYPVGLFVSSYAASYAAQYLGSILIQEMLGYNTTLNLDNSGSGALSGYYGLTGCSTPTNTDDRGCIEGVTTYSHITFESWSGYHHDWKFIQDTYSSMAPINRGNMGYMGFITAFIPKLVQEQAYSAQGVALEYYRNWNVSWNQPWNFFGGISSVEKRNLMPCNASMMQDDPAMRRHVQFTGDTDGVVIANEKYSGRCDDNYWWLPPACRSNPSTCVPWITGGTGWSVEEFMQKFTTWNMPVAVGVAATWGDYTTLPLAGNMAFYWWSPDPTFSELSPLRVEFPDFNKREHDQGIQTSQLNAISIDTLVSRDLPVLAPMVDRFADNLEISQAQMDALSLEQKNTGDSWENVTCRWVSANRATWQKWIPDQSACFPGFGLYDTVVKDFVEMRENATNQITCQACPPGTFSQKLEDSIGTGETYICVPCGLGTSQPSGAASSCTPCKVGGYQDELRSTECKRCPFRTYQDEEGQVACKSCPASTNTLGLGSIAPSDCGCLEDQIDMDRSDSFECVACMEGMKCPALSQLVDLENGTSANGELFTPMIMEGFYTTKDSPTEVFRCRSTRTCPGGTPGTCGGGSIGTPCSQCPAGATWTGSVCEDCAGWRQALWGSAVCGVFAFLTLAYYSTSSKVTAKATVLFATTASFGMLVMSMQNLGSVGTMTVEWPEGLQASFSFCQLFLSDIDSYGFSCLAGQSEPIRYLSSASIFPVGIAWLSLGYGLSRFFPEKYHWEGPKVCSTMGAFLQVGFSTMSATSLAPMMCFQHPNGLRSILKYPGVICGSADHTSMLVFAGILLVVFVFGFVALCGFAVWKVMQMLAWPWKVPLSNVTDCIISFCIVLTVTTSTSYLNQIESAMYGFASGVSTAMLSGIFAAISIMVCMTVSALIYRSAMGGQKESKMFTSGSVPNPEELSKKVKEMAMVLEKSDTGDIASKLAALSVFDTQKITTCVTLLATEVAPPLEDARSFKFNKRIASSSFDPALKRKPQSSRLTRETKKAEQPVESNEIVETTPAEQQAENVKKDAQMSTWI